MIDKLCSRRPLHDAMNICLPVSTSTPAFYQSSPSGHVAEEPFLPTLMGR